ncbi:DUF397 domain-containing protein [Actinokineospora sp. 24-640]
MEWKKSSRSTNTDNCVEVRQDLAAVRDSKNPQGPALGFSATSVSALIVKVARH